MTRIQPKSAVSMHCWRGIAIISLLVGAMLFRVWQKVEVAHMDGNMIRPSISWSP